MSDKNIHPNIHSYLQGKNNMFSKQAGDFDNIWYDKIFSIESMSFLKFSFMCLTRIGRVIDQRYSLFKNVQLCNINLPPVEGDHVTLKFSWKWVKWRDSTYKNYISRMWCHWKVVRFITIHSYTCAYTYIYYIRYILHMCYM